jgi:uncharacterized protein (TIGR02001 family)
VLAPSLRAAPAAVLWALCSAVGAQTAFSVTGLSDYRYRGVSLSNERPAVRAGVAHEGASGWFLGGSAVSVSLYTGGRQAQFFGYGGLTGTWGERHGWEAGATLVRFSDDAAFDYHEWFVGVRGERWNARLHHSPDYFGSGVRTAYGEVNGGMRLSREWRATAHAGALRSLRRVAGARDAWALDGALGVARASDAWDVGLQLIAGSRSGLYPVVYGPHARSALALSATYAF